MRIAGTILITRIACYVPSLQDLNLPSNRWVNFSVDLHEVICIKEFNPEDEESMGLEKRCAVVYTVNNNFSGLSPQKLTTPSRPQSAPRLKMTIRRLPSRSFARRKNRASGTKLERH